MASAEQQKATRHVGWMGRLLESLGWRPISTPFLSGGGVVMQQVRLGIVS